MWVSFGLLNRLPDPPEQEPQNHFPEKPCSAFSPNCQALSQAQGHQRQASCPESPALLKPSLCEGQTGRVTGSGSHRPSGRAGLDPGWRAGWFGESGCALEGPHPTPNTTRSH